MNVPLSLLPLAAFVALAAAPGRAASVPAPAPEVFISLRGLDGDRTIETGEPLFVAARIEVPFESRARIELAPAGGTWADAVEFVIAGAGETERRAQLVGRPERPHAILTEDESAAGEWLFPSATMQTLAPGHYTVQARLTLASGGGWRGAVRSAAMPLRVVAPGGGGERALQRTVALASESLAAGAPQDAVRVLDAILAREPNHIRLLRVRAIASAQGGDLRSADICLERALTLELDSKRQHPSPELHALDQQMLAAKLALDPRTPPPPAWTKLPASLLRPLPPPLVPKRAAPLAGIPTPASGVASSPAQPRAPVVPAPAAPTPAVAPPTPPPTPSGPPPGQLVPAAELDDAKIRADSVGQWAATARAGSQYSSPTYSAAKVTGAPDVAVAGNSPEAWCPGAQNGGTDWIELAFARPVRAAGVRVRQNLSPGAIVKVEAIAADGATHVWWAGVDPFVSTTGREIAWFGVRVPATDYAVAQVKLTLNLAAKPDWEQIDAVQLVAAP